MRNHFIKDLRIIKNRDLKHLLIVDNTILAFSNQLDNGIHIPTFFGSKSDKALCSLLPLLKSLAKEENVQSAIKKEIGISTLYDSYLKNQID